MYDKRGNLTRIRAVSIAVLSLLIFWLVTVVISGIFIAILSVWGHMHDLNTKEFTWFAIISVLTLVTALFLRSKLVISITDVEKHLQNKNFQVFFKSKRIEAKNGHVQVSLFLESTWRAYDPTPTWRIFREAEKWKTKRITGYDPSYMYKAGVLRILRHKIPPDRGALQAQLRFKKLDLEKEELFEDAAVIVNKAVGAWMGKYLLQEIDSALSNEFKRDD